MRDGRIFVCLLITGCALCFGAGCGKKENSEKIVARVNDYSMSVKDLMDEIEHSPYAAEEAKNLERLLDLAIRRQVLIQEAQREGLDREETFMETIERYWEQALIQELLEKKTREILRTVNKDEQKKALDDWLEGLSKKADIKINRQVLDELAREYEREGKR